MTEHVAHQLPGFHRAPALPFGQSAPAADRKSPYDLPAPSPLSCARFCAWLRIGSRQDNELLRTAMQQERFARQSAVGQRHRCLSELRAKLAETHGPDWQQEIARNHSMRPALRVLRTWSCRIGSVENARFASAVNSLQTWKTQQERDIKAKLSAAAEAPLTQVAPQERHLLARAALLRALEAEGVTAPADRRIALSLMSHFVDDAHDRSLTNKQIIAKAEALATQRATTVPGLWPHQNYLSHPPYRQWNPPTHAIQHMKFREDARAQVLAWLTEIRDSVATAFGCDRQVDRLRDVFAGAGLSKDAAQASALLFDDFNNLDHHGAVPERIGEKFQSLLRVLEALDAQAKELANRVFDEVSAEDAPELSRYLLANLFARLGTPADDKSRNPSASNVSLRAGVRLASNGKLTYGDIQEAVNLQRRSLAAAQ